MPAGARHQPSPSKQIGAALRLALAALLVVSVAGLAQENDPFSSSSEPIWPLKDFTHREKPVVSFPRSVTHRFDGKNHEYLISGLYTEFHKGKAQAPTSAIDLYIQPLVRVEVDIATKTCRVLTSREVTPSEFANAVDHAAYIDGMIPYWAELENRDLPVAIPFSTDLYEVVPPSPEVAAMRQGWFYLNKRRAFSSPLNLSAVEMGRLLIVPSTAYCMCHARFSIRILDAEGRIVWLNDDLAYSSVSIAITDVDGDDCHEILLRRLDHAEEAVEFLIRRDLDDAPP